MDVQMNKMQKMICEGFFKERLKRALKPLHFLFILVRYFPLTVLELVGQQSSAFSIYFFYTKSYSL